MRNADLRPLLATLGVIAACVLWGLSELLALQRARMPWARHRVRDL